MSRSDTLFSIRYAVRVLERHARLWHHIDVAVRLIGLLGGMSAIAALGAGSSAFTLLGGAVFALAQAVDVVLRPAGIAAASLVQRRAYADLLAQERQHGDDALEVAYQGVVAADEIHLPAALKRLAYNDVLDERGCDPAHRFAPAGLDGLFAVLS